MLCSMETVQRNGRFTLFSSKFPSNIYSILFVYRIDRQSYRRDTYKLKDGGGEANGIDFISLNDKPYL